MILVYVSGPFTAPTRAGVEANIARAEALAVEVARLGACPICPHANTSHPSFESVQPYQFWIDATLEMMRRCDAVVFTPDWRTSRGAVGEHAEAVRLGMPVFETVEELAEWIGRVR